MQVDGRGWGVRSLSASSFDMGKSDRPYKTGHRAEAIQGHPEKGCRDGEGSGGRKVAQVPWVVQPRAEEAEGRIMVALQPLMVHGLVLRRMAQVIQLS